MRKFGKLVIGGIQQKLFNLVLFAILLIVAAYTAVIVWQASSLHELVSNTSEQQKETITSTAKQALDERLTESLSATTQMEAYIADDMFRDLSHAVGTISDYAERLFENPNAYSAAEVAPPDAATDGVATVQLLTSKGANPTESATAQQIGLAGNMSNVMLSVLENSEIDACYIALPSGVTLFADDHASTKFAEDGSILPVDMTKRPWYTGAVDKGGIYFTDVVADVFTGEVGIVCAIPVYREDELVAVVGADLMLDTMAQYVANSGEGNDFVCIINDQGHVVFSPKAEGTFKVEDASRATDLRASDGPLADFVNASLGSATSPTVVEADGRAYYMSGAPVPEVGWAVVNAVDAQAIDDVSHKLSGAFDVIVDKALAEYGTNSSRSLTTIIVLLIFATVLALAGALVLSRRIVRPLGLITKRLQSLGGDDLQFVMEDEYRTDDEVEALAESFAKLSAKTLRYVDEVTRVTAEKERISTELNMATAIQASQLPRLFPAYPNRPEFDLFASMDPAKEVGGDFYDFYLVDDDHIALVMTDVSGKGVPAALFMMVSRILLKSHLQNGESPGEALVSVNEQLCEDNPEKYFVTVWVAVVQISTGKGIAANAGHEHPALRRAGDKFELVVYPHSPALGLIGGIPYVEHDFALGAGDSLFVYTDGVPEATNAGKEQFGSDRMLDALNEHVDANPEEVLTNVRKHVDAFVDKAAQFDDLTMLCFRYAGTQGES